MLAPLLTICAEKLAKSQVPNSITKITENQNLAALSALVRVASKLVDMNIASNSFGNTDN
jgi:hypothetical protein